MPVLVRRKNTVFLYKSSSNPHPQGKKNIQKIQESSAFTDAEGFVPSAEILTSDAVLSWPQMKEEVGTVYSAPLTLSRKPVSCCLLCALALLTSFLSLPCQSLDLAPPCFFLFFPFAVLLFKPPQKSQPSPNESSREHQAEKSS